jgi:TonB family protein
MSARHFRCALVLALLTGGGCAAAKETVRVSEPASSNVSTIPPAPRIFEICKEPHRDLPPFAGVAAYDAPEAVTKVAPEYPDAARKANIDGAVIVWALVCPHGHVLETRVENSIPALNDAAITAVSRWTFQTAKPGDDRSRWARCPIRFTLN